MLILWRNLAKPGHTVGGLQTSKTGGHMYSHTSPRELKGSSKIEGGGATNLSPPKSSKIVFFDTRKNVF